MALDSELRVRRVGQAIHGKIVEPVYAFDKLLIPAGTVVNGKVSAIDGVPGKTRALDATDGNFSPARHVHVQFDELVMGDGRHVALQTVASSAPDGVLRFVSANEKAEKKNKVEDAASKQVSATRQEIRRQWSDLQKQIQWELKAVIVDGDWTFVTKDSVAFRGPLDVMGGEHRQLDLLSSYFSSSDCLTIG